MTAGKPRADCPARILLQKREISGHPEREIEETMIDRFEFHGQLASIALHSRASIAGHAEHCLRLLNYIPFFIIAHLAHICIRF